MKRFFVVLTLFAFAAGPAAFGAAPTPEQIYKTTYIDIMQGKDPGQTLQALTQATAQSGVSVKDVLEAAVKRGWMSQDQLDSILELGANNAHLFDQNTAEKIAKNQLSKQDLARIAKALRGQVTGAGYCGPNCHIDENPVYEAFAALVLVVLIVGIEPTMPAL